MKKLVILDRDGVINYDSSNYIKSSNEWQPIPGSLEGIAQLIQHGFTVAVATNQAGIGRKILSLPALNEIHQKMQLVLQTLNAHIDKIVFCPHHPNDNCLCRKPKPGLLLEILAHYAIDPTITPVYFIGDSEKDLLAAHAANCIPMLVETGNGLKTKQKANHLVKPEHIFKDLLQAANYLTYMSP